MTAWQGMAGTDEWVERNRALRGQVIEYGERNYDPKTHLVYRNDDQYKDVLDVCQQSPAYAAALLDAGRDIDRANAIVSAVLDHQWPADKGTVWEGNFIWWHHLKRPEDANAVAFMTPWLCYYLLEHTDRLTPENRARLSRALPPCLQSIRRHSGQVHYDNIWLLKAASVLMLARTMGQPELLTESESRLDQWLRYVSQNGLNEYNSPCYAAVNIYALEFLWRYAPASAEPLRAKTSQALDYLYADAFQSWHWEGSIGAGTHSRAYPRDRVTGKSLVGVCVYKQCGGALRTPVRAFEYNFVVNDYPVPEPIRAWARRGGEAPLWLRASHPVHETPERVERCLYTIPEVSLGTQTGHRVAGDQAVPFKITYGRSKADVRATLIRPIPATLKGRHLASPVRFAAHQEGPSAIVLYEADMKGLREDACLRLVIEPAAGGMLDEILVDGKPYARERLDLKPGATIAWRVADALVGIRLLDGWGVDAEDPVRLAPKGYAMSQDNETGLCLHGLVAHKVQKPVGVNDLSCGFVVRVGTVREFGHLARLADAMRAWRVDETRKDATRDVSWQAGGTTLRLVWDGARNAVLERRTDGRKLAPFPLYESPLINLKPGDPPLVAGVRHAKE